MKEPAHAGLGVCIVFTRHNSPVNRKPRPPAQKWPELPLEKQDA